MRKFQILKVDNIGDKSTTQDPGFRKVLGIFRLRTVVFSPYPQTAPGGPLTVNSPTALPLPSPDLPMHRNNKLCMSQDGHCMEISGRQADPCSCNIASRECKGLWNHSRLVAGLAVICDYSRNAWAQKLQQN